MCSGSKILIPQIMGTFEDKITIEDVGGGVFTYKTNILKRNMMRGH